MVANGTIPVFSANVFEPFGYVDKLLIEDFSKDSILWGIDGDWLVNLYHKNKPFYPTDHCGVLRVLTNKVHPRYAARLLECEGKKMGFSRSYRASIDRVEGMVFYVPNIMLQNQAMEKVLDYEAKIQNLELSLRSLDNNKMDIINSFIK